MAVLHFMHPITIQNSMSKSAALSFAFTGHFSRCPSGLFAARSAGRLAGRFSLALLTCVFLFSFVSARTASASTRGVSKECAIQTPLVVELCTQERLINRLFLSVERIDQARLFVLGNSIRVVLQEIADNRQNNRPEMTFKTIRLLQHLIVQYRFSAAFFGWTQPPAVTSILTPSTAPLIAQLNVLAVKLAKDYGLDDSPYTQITAGTFAQMQRILRALEDVSLDASLKGRLRQLWEPIGVVIALANQGDRPKAFERARPMVRAMRELYPYFNQVSASSAGFSLVLELQGLIEFYAEFAQVDELPQPEQAAPASASR